ncbi:hypothetical protein AB4Y85_07090 [Microvirga sp. 2YAF29]|uniref:hypothetical protein n=1 Tax=Microvirga sp. 2YAF29 TaxID=3233031 RepID=UPI003F96387B
MRRILIGTLTITALAFGASAMAQTPVPGASGSQVTNPKVYRNYAEKEHQQSMLQQQRKLGLTTGSVAKPHAKKKHHTMHH